MSGKKRKGLSGDEKRDVILRCYHEALQPFNLKEIENMASKAGVVLQTVSAFISMSYYSSQVNDVIMYLPLYFHLCACV